MPQSLCINPNCQRPQNSDTTQFCQNCGSELVIHSHYRVREELGAGGFGKTYIVASSNLSPPLVLKVLINAAPKAVELFQREAEVMTLLKHPGIPHVEQDSYFVYFPRNSAEPLHCLVMEKIEGLNLQEYMQQRGNRPVNQKLVLQWLIEIVEILEQVHSLNFFHRDIKPSNIMLRTDGRLALIDFGTARAVTGTYMAKQAAGNITGIISTGYTPVEQLNGQAVQQSDFYALGRTMVYLLTAQEPSDIYIPQTDEFPWRNYALDVAPAFADYLDRMMARLPSQRPGNTQGIKQYLLELQKQLTTQDPAQLSGPPPAATQAAVPYPPAPISTPSFPAAAPPPWPQSAPMGLMGNAGPAYPEAGYPQASYGGWQQPGASSLPRYASFWERFMAIMVDGFLITVGLIGLSIILGIIIQPLTQSEVVGQTPEYAFGYAVGTALALMLFTGLPLLTWLYFAVLEGSAQHATIGKRIMGIRVTTVQFEPVGFGLATLRFMAKLLSTVTVFGFIMAGFTDKRQALHDLMTSTIVVKKTKSASTGGTKFGV